jgi:CRP/FNR family transcriptional regulator
MDGDCMKCEHNNVSRCVDNVPIFSNMNEQELEEIIDISTHKVYNKGDMIYQAGDMSEKLYVVHEGQIKISRLSEDGKEQVIRVLGPGEFLGELALFSHMPMTDFAQALMPTTVCIINGNEIKNRINKYPNIALKIIEELSKRLERIENLVENINLHSVEWRLAQVLLNMADELNEVELNTSKGNFASQIGMSQETLSRKLTLFQDKKLIKQMGHRRIFILDKKGLQAID